MNGLSEEIFESDYEGEGEFSDMEAGDYESDYEADYEGEWGYQGEAEGEGPFSEEQEIEMAAELLSLAEEGEMDQFLGKLFKSVSQATGLPVPPTTKKALGGFLRKAAQKALPLAGRAVGTFFGGPAGGALGSKLASAGGQIFGLEMEGMSAEDQELQVAKQFVRLAGDAIAKASQAPSGAAPQQVARAALASAARQHAPGLLRNGGGAAPGASFGGAQVPRGRKRTGRWIRRGNKIVLFGV